MRKVTLIKRSSPACPGCSLLQTMLNGEGIEHDVIDIAEQPEAVEQYDLSGVPVVLIGEGPTQFRLDGVQPIEKIKELIGK